MAIYMAMLATRRRARKRGYAAPVMLPLALALSTYATVLGFSEDGTRAVVEERTDDGAGSALRYLVVGRAGRTLVVAASDTTAALDGARRRRAMADKVDRDACRAGARALEDALADFRTVKVRISGCAKPARSLVETLRTAPAPLSLGPELLELERASGMAGRTFVNEDGPLVVVIAPDPADALGVSVLERVFLRKDPRINKRWPDP